MSDSTERGSRAASHEEQKRNLFHSVLATLRDEKKAGISGAATEATMLASLYSPAATAPANASQQSRPAASASAAGAGHSSAQGAPLRRGEAADDAGEGEVERLYQALRQSVHLRDGFQQYHKLCAQESVQRTKEKLTGATGEREESTEAKEADGDVGAEPTSVAPAAAPGEAAVRLANAERFRARASTRRALDRR